jgi:nucleoside-diphosphate-sugar epimerase
VTPTCFFIFGLGYTAQAFADLLVAQQIKVVGTSRTPESYTKKCSGVNCIDFYAHDDIEHYIEQATHILITIPPINNTSDVVMEKYAALIKKQASKLKWIGYLSSTGVYGNHKGRWVNEQTPCQPHTQTAIIRLHTEQRWLHAAHIHALPLHIFRLAGIYGPGRNAIERILAGKKYSIFKENQVFSRIHVEDIANIMWASAQHPQPYSIYNLSDDEPAPAHIVDEYAAKLLHRQSLPLIPFSEAVLSPMEREFYTNNRRVSNFKIKKELQITLKYPTYREGLEMIWRNKIEEK